MPYVASLQSHAQIKPIVQLLTRAELSPEETGQLANMFANALSQFQGDERSFAITNSYTDEFSAPGAVASLIETLKTKGISSVTLLRAFREYLVKNFDTEYCGDIKNAPVGRLPQAVQYFNQQLQQLQSSQVFPVTTEDLTGASAGPKFVETPFWQSSQAKELESAIRELRFGGQRNRLTVDKKATSEWSAKLIEFLTKLGAWKSGDEQSAADFFCEKSILYTTLIDVIPTGPERSRAITDFVEFLQQNSPESVNRIEWMFPVERLLSGAVASDDRGEVLRAFLDSGDPTLSLYARLERWEPRNLRGSGRN